MWSVFWSLVLWILDGMILTRLVVKQSGLLFTNGDMGFLDSCMDSCVMRSMLMDSCIG